ncbi:MAG: tRNA (adenosine(37)-N6)-threonylcarbamoyltransferase complex dimerization subunit type 1 TsaB [Pseudomonadota bacterium]|uniref:tRNA (adenosine(37)-N6)-threonylcarbamoyltransferase complex dimerization subunit type 1 TsaB n=1 Tax=Thermithiobacillus tepidarius TaxID=929 RepID=UPI00042022A4|nr:tRNA (adenosine(37)-N6)-threonylcarbamoyltransferase complex dimerization subunit type 1 TsaB [Thermithiobacillus tepidarius]
MTTLLAIETATEACSVALLHGGEVTERFEVAPLGHAALVTAMIDQVLAEAGVRLGMLDAIAFGRGPGSFTGVRVAVSAAQGLALALDRPLIPVSSLQAVAMETDYPRVLAAFDARKGEVYWGIYVRAAGQMPTLQGEECVAVPERVPVPAGDAWFGVGTGWGAHADALSARLAGRLQGMAPAALPRAAAVVRLALPRWLAGEAVDVEQALPVYIRPSQAEENRS